MDRLCESGIIERVEEAIKDGQVRGRKDGGWEVINISGTPSSIEIDFIAGETIAIGDVLYLHTDGTVKKATDILNLLNIVGMAKTSGSSTSTIKVVTNGIFTTSGLTAGSSYYNSTSGTLSTVNSKNFIGVARTTTELLLFSPYSFLKNSTVLDISGGISLYRSSISNANDTIKDAIYNFYYKNGSSCSINKNNWSVIAYSLYLSGTYYSAFTVFNNLGNKVFSKYYYTDTPQKCSVHITDDNYVVASNEYSSSFYVSLFNSTGSLLYSKNMPSNGTEMEITSDSNYIYCASSSLCYRFPNYNWSSNIEYIDLLNSYFSTDSTSMFYSRQLNKLCFAWKGTSNYNFGFIISTNSMRYFRITPSLSISMESPGNKHSIAANSNGILSSFLGTYTYSGSDYIVLTLAWGNATSYAIDVNMNTIFKKSTQYRQYKLKTIYQNGIFHIFFMGVSSESNFSAYSRVASLMRIDVRVVSDVIHICGFQNYMDRDDNFQNNGTDVCSNEVNGLIISSYNNNFININSIDKSYFTSDFLNIPFKFDNQIVMSTSNSTGTAYTYWTPESRSDSGTWMNNTYACGSLNIMKKNIDFINS
jgi:hypothetical protein